MAQRILQNKAFLLFCVSATSALVPQGQGNAPVQYQVLIGMLLSMGVGILIMIARTSINCVGTGTAESPRDDHTEI